MQYLALSNLLLLLKVLIHFFNNRTYQNNYNAKLKSKISTYILLAASGVSKS